MFDDFVTYYHENVAAAFIEYRKTSRDKVAGRSLDLRGAIDAATMLFHIREHLPSSITLTRAAAERRCVDYALLGDVVNAAKHRTLTSSTPHGSPLVTDATNLGERLLMIEYTDGDGIYRCAQKSVIAVLADGSERNLLEVLTNVINFWELYLHSKDVLAKPRVFKSEPQLRYRTRAECDEIRLNFEIVQGQRFKQTMQFLQFDQAANNATPVDLTGSKLKFSLDKPRIEFEVSLKNQASGKEHSTMTSLNEEESAVIFGLTTDDARQTYVMSLPTTQEALRKLAKQAGMPQVQQILSIGGASAA